MTSIANDKLTPLWTDASALLPADTLRRLTTLTRVCLGDEDAQVAVVSLPEPQLAEMFVANEITTDASLKLPRNTRAFARIVLRDPDGGADVHFDDEHPVQLALLVSCMEPRTWTAHDIELLKVVAGTAASELRLRATLVREARMADELRDHPLHDP